MLQNPYLEEAAPYVVSGDRFAYLQLPWERVAEGFAYRHGAVLKYAWAVPDEGAVRKIASFGPIVEMGAGNGYWAKLLREAGADVVAYDDAVVTTPYWSTVLSGKPEVLRQHADRALLLVWPPYDDPMADECLRYYEGSTLCYVGEGPGGCTGDDAFHERLDAEWKLSGTVAIPQYYGIHDSLYIYRRDRKPRSRFALLDME